MAPGLAGANRGNGFTVVGVIAFLVVVALFALVSTKAGTHGLGVLMIGSAFMQCRAGRVPYGIEGRPPAGYIEGWAATVINALFLAAGVGLIVWPEVAIGIFRWGKA